eukprot:5385974-Amphidinium_carterae.4
MSTPPYHAYPSCRALQGTATLLVQSSIRVFGIEVSHRENVHPCILTTICHDLATWGSSHMRPCFAAAHFNLEERDDAPIGRKVFPGKILDMGFGEQCSSKFCVQQTRALASVSRLPTGFSPAGQENSGHFGAGGAKSLPPNCPLTLPQQSNQCAESTKSEGNVQNKRAVCRQITALV